MLDLSDAVAPLRDADFAPPPDMAVVRGRADRRRRRHQHAAFAVPLLVLLAAVVSVSLAVGRSNSSGTVSNAPATLGEKLTTSPPSTISVDQQALEDEAWVRLQEMEKAGWSPYSGDTVIDGHPTPAGAVVKVSERFPDLSVTERYPLSTGRYPVYVGVDGAQIGWHYVNLGYLPLELVDGFDAAAARAAKFGCDPLGPSGPACQQTIRSNSGG